MSFGGCILRGFTTELDFIRPNPIADIGIKFSVIFWQSSDLASPAIRFSIAIAGACAGTGKDGCFDGVRGAGEFGDDCGREVRSGCNGTGGCPDAAASFLCSLILQTVLSRGLVLIMHYHPSHT
jgi:hypothetical protein